MVQRLGRSLKIIFVYLCLITLGELWVIASLLAEPSKSGGFLGFSSRRWGMLFIDGLVLLGLLFALYRLWTKPPGRLETWLDSERHRSRLLILSGGIFAASLAAALGWIPFIRHFAYFGRLRPSLLWLAFASGSVTLTLLVVLRRSILAWLRGFLPLETVSPTMPLTRTQRLVMGGVALGYLALHLNSHLQVRQAMWLPDSIDYIFPATTYGWTEAGLWMHTKPWGAAVLYKLTGSSPTVIDAVQEGLSALAWMALGWVFARFLRPSWLRVTAFGLILGFSLAPAVQMWNHIIQSESLSITLMIAILATWMMLLQTWRWKTWLVLLFLFAWWIGTRETNIYLALFVAGILGLIGLFYKRQRFYWVLSLVLIWFCLFNLRLSEKSVLPHWLYPLTNTILHRILPRQEFVQYFEAHGMPVTPELMALSGGYADSGDFAVFNNNALNDMERWLYQHGKQVYILFLLEHPAYTFLSPWQNLGVLLSPDGLGRYAPPLYKPPLPWLFGSLLFPDSLWLVAGLTLAALAAALFGRIWRAGPLAWLIIGFLTLFWPHIYLVWHGDAAEVGRHAIQASIQVRLGLWLIVLLGLSSHLSKPPLHS